DPGPRSGSRLRRREWVEEDYPEEDSFRRRGPAPRVNNWPKVRIGLLIVFIAMCVFTGGHGLVMFADLLFLILVYPSKINPKVVDTGQTFIKVAVVFVLLGQVGAIAGYVFGLFAPNKYGALGLAIATLAVAAIHLILDLVFRVLPIFDNKY